MKNGIDTGFCFKYSKLSFRRKFIRNILRLAISLIAIYLFYGFANSPSVFLRVLFYAALLDATIGTLKGAYSYIHWKREIKESEGNAAI